jgi:hypothetical protein
MGALEDKYGAEFEVDVYENPHPEDNGDIGFCESAKRGSKEGWEAGWREENDTINRKEAYSPTNISYELTYQVNGANHSSIKAKNAISTITIKDNSYKSRLIYRFTLLCYSLLFFLVIYELRKIFGILKHAENTNDWFSRRIYKALLRISLYTLALIITAFIVNIVSSEIVDHITINGLKQCTSTVLPDFESILTFIFLFIISQVYKAGVVMREEQDLII